MLLKTFEKFCKTATNHQNKWILSKWNSFGDFRNDVKKGDTMSIPTKCIVPRSKHEWENSRSGRSKTNDLIELSFESNRFNADLILHDGHNRLRDLLRKKIKTTKVKIV